MNSLKRGLAAFMAAAFALCLMAPLAMAQPVAARTVFLQGVADATATQTFATTSYADLAAATVSFVPRFDSTIVEAPGTPTKVDYIRVTVTYVMSKATATTGTCAVFANGAIVTKTAQAITTAATNANVSGVFYLVNSLAGTQTVKLQCKSGDTNVFTVTSAHLIVEELR